MKSMIKQFFDYDPYKFKSNVKWFLIIFLMKILLITYIRTFQKCSAIYGIACMYGDSFSYIKGYENLILSGNYGEPIRMPFVGFIYYLLRLLFNQNIAASGQVVFQIIISALSILLFAKLSFNISKRKISFYLAIIMSLLLLRVTFYDTMLLSESLSYSFMIFWAYTYYKHLNFKSDYYLFLSLIFLNILIGLKNYLSLFYIVVFIHFYLNSSDIIQSRRGLLYVLMWVIMPFLFFGPWTIRNLNNYGKLIVFQKDIKGGYNISFSDEYMEIISLFGYSHDFYFFLPSDKKHDAKFAITFLYKILNERNLVSPLIKNTIDSLNTLINKNQKYSNIYVLREKPYYFRSLKLIKQQILINNKYNYKFYYYIIKGRVYNTLKMIIKGIVNFIPHNGISFKIVRIANILVYLLLLLFYFRLICIKRFKFEGETFFLVIPTYVILFFFLIIPREEHRYFYISYPWLILSLLYQENYAALKKLIN